MATASSRHSLLQTNNIKLLITDGIVPEKNYDVTFSVSSFLVLIFTTKLPCVLSKRNKRKKMKVTPPIPLTLQNQNNRYLLVIHNKPATITKIVPKRFQYLEHWLKCKPFFVSIFEMECRWGIHTLNFEGHYVQLKTKPHRLDVLCRVYTTKITYLCISTG